jgi:hypothetical protein
MEKGHPLILRLKQFNQRQLEEIYNNCFMTDAGQLVMEDLKARFWEYKPIEGPNAESITFNAGQQSVLIHLKNMLNPLPQEEDVPHGKFD